MHIEESNTYRERGWRRGRAGLLILVLKIVILKLMIQYIKFEVTELNLKQEYFRRRMNNLEEE